MLRSETTRPSSHGRTAKRRERSHHDEKRRELEQEPIGAVDDDVFFEDELDAVGEALQHAVPAHSHRPEPVLDVRRHLALEPDQKDGELGDEADGGAHPDGGGDDVSHVGEKVRVELAADRGGDLREQRDEHERTPGAGNDERRKEVRDLALEFRTFHGH